MRPDLKGVTWRKSSRSNGNNGDCVMIGCHDGNRAFIGDSKDPNGPVLQLTDAAINAFVQYAKRH